MSRYIGAWKVPRPRSRFRIIRRRCKRQSKHSIGDSRQLAPLQSRLTFPATRSETLFRRMIRETLNPSEVFDLLSTIANETPRPRGRARVNAWYPGEDSLVMMWPSLLRVFPPLPEELQYGFLNGFLNQDLI